MPPEVKDRQGQVELSKAVDVFSFGCLVAHVASCDYPTPSSDPLGVRKTEFQKRAHYIEKQQHIFYPLMERCLNKQPPARGTFEDVKDDIQVLLKKYCGKKKQIETLEDKTQEIEKMKSELTKLQRTHDNLKEQHAALALTCKEAQEAKAKVESTYRDLVRERDTLAEEKKMLEREVMLAKQETQQTEQRAQGLELSLSKVGSADVIFQKYESAKEEVKGLEEERTRLKEEVARLQSDKEHLSQAHTNVVLKSDEYCQAKERLQSEVDRLSRELQGAQQSLGGIRGQKVTVEQQKQAADKQIKELQGQLDRWKDKCQKAERGLESGKAKNQELTKQNQGMTSAVNQRDSELRSANAKVTNLEQRKKTLENERDAVVREKDKTKATLANRESELSSERQKSQSLNNDVTAKQREIEQLKAQVKTKGDELWSEKNEKSQLQTKVAEGDAKVRSQKQTLEKLRQEKQTVDDECRRLQIDLKATKEERDTLQQAKETLEQERTALTVRKTGLEAQLRVRQDDLKVAQAEVYTLKKQRDTLAEGAKVGEGLEKQWSEDKIKLEKDLEEKQAQLQKTQSRMDTATVQLKEADAVNNQLETTILQLQKELELQKLEHQKALAEQVQELTRVEARKAVVEKDLTRARKMMRDLVDERVAFNAESEQKMENLNEKLVEFKQQAVLSEERLGQVHGLKDEHHDLKLQLKKLTTALEHIQKLVSDEQKSRKSLDASVKALRTEITQLRTQLQERDNEMSFLATANMNLQRKADTADAHVIELRSEAASLKEQVNHVSEDNCALKQTLDEAEAAVQKQKRDYEEKLREAEEQVALFQRRQQQLTVFKDVAEELKTQLTCLMTDAPSPQNPTVGSEEDGASTTVLVKEAAQKMQMLEAERDSYKAELHMYQMKWCDAEELIETLQKQKQFLEATSVHIKVTEEYLRDEYKRKFSEAFKLIKTLHDQEEGGSQSPPVMTMLSALMDICKYFKDESADELERAAEEKQRILASKEELDGRVDEMACRIAEMKECIAERDRDIRDLKAQLASLQKLEVAPAPLPSEVNITGDEMLLQQLCYMATGIKQLNITPDGGNFTLGCGDATLEFPPRAVVKETSIRYAIILHGPFVFPAGYKPGSVVVYLNMDGATLVKPVQLLLSHWCVREEDDDEESLRFVHAPHTLEAGQQKYTFEEQEEADFTTRTNVGALTFRHPHCLFCVETKNEKIARYSAIAFSSYFPSEDTLLFRIQLMCDSREWNEKLTTMLQRKNWEKTISGDVVTQFQYATGYQQITASPQELAGPGWKAAIYGQQAVIDEMFLVPLGKSKEEIEGEVNSGRFPPCILYKIIYVSPEENRPKPAMMKVLLHGANVPLVFCCRVKEDMTAAPPVSPATSEPVSGAATSPSAMETVQVDARDLLTSLNHQLDAQWRHFGTFLGVEYQVMEAIQRDKGGNPTDCMLDLLGKWTSNQAGTGTLPRTWQTVVEAVQYSGDRALAQDLARKYRGHLPH